MNLNKGLTYMNLFTKRTSLNTSDEEKDDGPQDVLNTRPAAARRLDSRADADPKADAKAYNLLASAAVDLSDAFVFNGIFSGTLMGPTE
jgi:hypothetical protein